MSDGPLDEPGGERSEADELLRELIPGESGSGHQSEMVTGQLTWSGAQSPPGEAAPEGERDSGTNDVDSGLSGSATLPVADTARRRGDPRWLTITLAFLAGIALLALAFQAGLASRSGSTDASDRNDTTVGTDGADEAAAPTPLITEGTTAGVVTDEAGGQDRSPLAAGSSLRLTLDNYQLTVDGVVPSEEIKEGIEERMGAVFADFGSSTLAVDPGIEPADWLEAAPSLINTMILLHDGMIDVTEDGVNVSGRALASDFAKLEAALTPERGFPAITIAEQEVVDQPAPWVRAVATGDGTVTITGELADETMRSTIVDGSREVYGADNVIDRTTVNPERHNRFLIMRFPSNLAAYQAFGEFDIKGENESFTAILETGLVFEILETELTPASRERLAGIMFTLTRNPLPVTVVGHSDGVGSQAANQALSEIRAESVATFLIDNGVLAQNVETSGLGESDPVDTNATAEGRARNRRVEITIGLDNQGVSG